MQFHKKGSPCYARSSARKGNVHFFAHGGERGGEKGFISAKVHAKVGKQGEPRSMETPRQKYRVRGSAVRGRKKKIWRKAERSPKMREEGGAGGKGSPPKGGCEKKKGYWRN